MFVSKCGPGLMGTYSLLYLDPYYFKHYIQLILIHYILRHEKDTDVECAKWISAGFVGCQGCYYKPLRSSNLI